MTSREPKVGVEVNPFKFKAQLQFRTSYQSPYGRMQESERDKVTGRQVEKQWHVTHDIFISVYLLQNEALKAKPLRLPFN